MKTILVLLTLIVSSSVSFASISTPIDLVRTLNFDGKILELSYQIGGGCQEHTSVVSVSIKENVTGFTEAIVNVQDVTPAEDFCEALLGRQVKVDLAALISEACSKSSVTNCDAKTLRLVLPNVLYSPY